MFGRKIDPNDPYRQPQLVSVYEAVEWTEQEEKILFGGETTIEQFLRIITVAIRRAEINYFNQKPACDPKIYVNSSPDYEELNISLSGERMESAQEAEERWRSFLSSEQKWQLDSEERERAEYNRLKKKFES